MSGAPRILLAPDSGPGVGGGHVLRTIALAQALQSRGADCVFALAPHGLAVFDRYGEGAGRALRLESEGSAALASAAREVGADVVVIDSYRAEEPQDESWSGPRPRIAVIDDLADRRRRCDLLVDPGYGRRAEDYAGLVPDACTLLTGPPYALLRRPFADPPTRTPPRGDIRRAFVAFGLSDVGSVTARAVLRLRHFAPDLEIDVAMAADAASLPRLRDAAASDARLHLHVDARDVATLMGAADVAVGAGGASTWERCALGLASLTVVVADNQRRVVQAMEADGVLLACDLADPDFEGAFDAGWTRLQDSELRHALSRRGRAVCDGLGAGRVADAILAL